MNATAMTAIKMPGLTSVPRSTDKDDISAMQTMIITPGKLAEWPLPGLQRPLVQTKRVRDAAEAMQLEAAKFPSEACATIDGVITLGRVGNKTYLVDGQHRLYGAFAWACRELLVHGGVVVKQAYADVRLRHFGTMADLSDAFVNLNSQLNATKPDDILRALAASNEDLQAIEAACPFIGYDLTGAAKKSKLLSMSSAIRTWFGSGGLVPAGGPPALDIVRKFLSKEQADAMIDFYSACVEAGWHNEQFRRLWSTLNLGIVMWLYRRVVRGEVIRYQGGGHKPMVLTRGQFIVCMSTLINGEYLEWLKGGSLRARDRVPCYTHIKDLFAVALEKMGIKDPRFPMAQWS